MLSKALSGLSRKKMSTVDTAWLRMDSEGNLMMIVGVAMLVRFAGVRFTWRIFLSIYNHINFGSADPAAIHARNFQDCTQV